MPYSLSDRVLFGLLAVEDGDLRRLLSAIARIESDPVGSCQAAAYDRRGRLVYAASNGRYWLYYWINRSGRVHFVEMLRDS
jgi:hypothetical protein